MLVIFVVAVVLVSIVLPFSYFDTACSVLARAVLILLSGMAS